MPYRLLIAETDEKGHIAALWHVGKQRLSAQPVKDPAEALLHFDQAEITGATRADTRRFLERLSERGS